MLVQVLMVLMRILMPAMVVPLHRWAVGRLCRNQLARALLSRCISLLFLRAAWLRCITPFLTATSNALAASLTIASVSGAPGSESMALLAADALDRMYDLTERLRAVRLRWTRCDLAAGISYLSLHDVQERIRVCKYEVSILQPQPDAERLIADDCYVGMR